jgi:hypothetical protein
MPITESILDRSIIGKMIRNGVEEGREKGRKDGIRQGEMLILRGLLDERFGSLPAWVDERLGSASRGELLTLGRRLLKAGRLEALFE